MSRIGKASREKIDVRAAEDELEAQRENFVELERELQEEIAELEERWTSDNVDIEEVVLRPKKSDIAVNDLGLVWLPFAVFEDGRNQRLA